jgi:hypothetical protein
MIFFFCVVVPISNIFILICCRSIVGTATISFEIAQTVPQFTRLKDLLVASAYDGEENEHSVDPVCPASKEL